MMGAVLRLIFYFRTFKLLIYIKDRLKRDIARSRCGHTLDISVAKICVNALFEPSLFSLDVAARDLTVIWRNSTGR
jgi:hypothetical protein